MAIQVDDREHHPEPGMGIAMLTVLAMILTIAVLSLLIWAMMIGVAATTAGRSEHAAPQKPGEMMMEQKALPAKP
jgi:Na+-transporting methylmalonyl-CoA/oxaloacetate decarboxylase gamma subunit